MKDKPIQYSPRSAIESRIDDINIILSSCYNPSAAMISIKNLSSDLSSYRLQQSISNEEHFGYMTRLEKMILDWGKDCSCHKSSKKI